MSLEHDDDIFFEEERDVYFRKGKNGRFQKEKENRREKDRDDCFYQEREECLPPRQRMCPIPMICLPWCGIPGSGWFNPCICITPRPCPRPWPPPCPPAPPPRLRACTEVPHHPECFNRVLCAELQLPPLCRIEHICVEIVDTCWRDGCLRVCYRVSVKFIDCRGNCRECCRLLHAVVPEIPHCCCDPCVQLVGDPKFELCDCWIKIITCIRVNCR